MTSIMSIVEADLVVQERNDNDKKDEKKQRLQFDFDYQFEYTDLFNLYIFR